MYTFDDLRIGSFNCQATGTTNEGKLQKFVKYCVNSECDIVALQETNSNFNSNTDSRFATFEKKLMLKPDDVPLTFFIKDESMFADLKVEQKHQRLAVLTFKYKGVKFALFNFYGVVPDSGSKILATEFFKFLRSEMNKVTDAIVIGCGDMNAFPRYASLGIHLPRIKPHVYGSFNNHGDCLINFLRESKTFHLNSMFEKPRDRKWTRRGYEGQNNTELDGFISNRTDIVQDVDSFIGKGNKSDHRLIGSLWRVSKEYEKNRNKQRGKANWTDYATKLSGALEKATVSQYQQFLNILIDAKPAEADEAGILKPLDRSIFSGNVVARHLIYLFADGDVQRSLAEKYQQVMNEAREKSLKFTDNEVKTEVAELTFETLAGADGVTVDMIRHGGVPLAAAITKLFNNVFSKSKVPPLWVTILFERPVQSVFTESIDYYNFPGRRSILANMYSNIIARRSIPILGPYIYGNQWYYKNDPKDFETLMREKSIENMFILEMLLLKYKKAGKPIYLRFVTFENAYSSVNISSVVDSLKEAKLPGELLLAFTTLLSDTFAKFENLEKVEKKRGLHLGNVANSLLLSAVVKTIRNRCKTPDVGIKIGQNYLRCLQFNDQLVLIDDKETNLETHWEKLRQVSEKHGLSFALDKVAQIDDYEDHRCVVYCDQITPIASNFGLEIIRRVVEAKKLMSTLRPRSTKAQNLEFFNNQLIPKFFNACETWNPQAAQIKKINEHIQSFLSLLSLPNREYPVSWKILLEKARFVKWISTKKNSFCYKLLTEPTTVINPVGPNQEWTNELVKKFKDFLKQQTNYKVLIGDVHGHGLLEIAAGSTGIWAGLWDAFISSCEKKVNEGDIADQFSTLSIKKPATVRKV